MSIVERERQAEEVQGPITEREHRARTFEAAALELEVNGWLQGALCDSGGRLCMMGGIDAAMSGVVDLLQVMNLWSPDWRKMFWPLSDAALLPLAHFNDHIAQSADDVSFALRWRAEEIRDGR